MMEKTKNILEKSSKILLGLTIVVALPMIGASAYGVSVNPSSSTAHYLYKSISKQPQKGLYVSFCVPEEHINVLYKDGIGKTGSGGSCGRVLPFIKPVIAVSGDVVSVSDDGITTKDGFYPAPRKKVSTKGTDLNPIKPGTYKVSPGKVWVLSTFNPSSYDSRYYGEVMPLQSFRPFINQLKRSNYE